MSVEIDVDEVAESAIVQESPVSVRLTGCNSARGRECCTSAGWHKEVCNGARCRELL